jgi:hypothetical protein
MNEMCLPNYNIDRLGHGNVGILTSRKVVKPTEDTR